ncbi:MAG: methylenetetrahydrofolate reductase [NAD(P)H] [Desulfuromonadia bacterium]
MKIIETMSRQKPFLSLEFFPPKDRSDWDEFFGTVSSLSTLSPLFVSVTYGAGGSAHSATLEIVTRITTDLAIPTMAHLTCINSTTDEIDTFLARLADSGIENVLALRGDPPQGESPDRLVHPPLSHASDLVSHIRSRNPRFGIAVAAYPEPHPESTSPEADLNYLKLKLDNGADFAITQLFFDNQTFVDFVRRARAIGITQPIIPGILPVVSMTVINRIISLCGATIPPSYRRELEEADRQGGSEQVREVGIAHARRQIADLLDRGVPGVHLYTLNRGDVTRRVVEGLF